MIISILNQKGGTGKTTLAVNLARYYTMNNVPTLLVDSDAQGSALRWHEQSEGNLIDLTCLPANTLDKDVMKFRNHYSRIIIDGVPRVSPLTVCAIKAADLVLIPVQPSPYDIWATEDLVRLVKERIEMTDGKLKAAFIVSRKISRTNIAKEVYDELKQFELPIFHSATTQRVNYAKGVSVGFSVFENMENDNIAPLEIKAIANEIEEFMKNGIH